MSGVTPDDIRGLEDLDKIPFTSKNDLRETYPYGLFAVPMKDVVRLHASSGTTGKQIVVGYTAEDLDIFVFNLTDPQNIVRAVNGENIGTLVKSK